MTGPNPGEAGRASQLPRQSIVEAARLVKEGRQYSLATSRFPGMPLFPGHPPFQVLNYRTPPGIRAEGAQPWGPPNEVGLGYMAEYVMATSHSGAHVDALPAGEPVGADELAEIAAAQGVEITPWDVVLIRTGYLKYWPDAEEMAKHRTAGPDLSAAEWLLEKGVIATGTDTETYEVQPAPDRGSPANPQPVHTKLLIENGIYLLESVYLEELATDRVYEFLFVALPVKIEGATGSMVDPLAVI